MSATKLRGRHLYHVVYEDGDSEDMNDKELLKGHEMYNRQTAKTFQTSASFDKEDEVGSENDKSGGDTEGSSYGDSDEEELAHKKNTKNCAWEEKCCSEVEERTE